MQKTLTVSDLAHPVKYDWVRAPFGPSPLQQLADFWHRRRLLVFLFSYGFSRLYGKTMLGTAWLFLRPGIMVAGSVLVVGKMLGFDTAPVPLTAFILASFAPWLLFQRGLMMSTNSFGMFKSLSRSFLFPRTMAHIASIGPSILICLALLSVAILALLYFSLAGHYSFEFGLHLLWVPISILMTICLVLALSFFTAPLNAIAGDTKFVLRYVLTLMMVVSPVFYPISKLGEQFREYMWYNPLACILELYRWGLFHQEEPWWWHVWLSMGVIALLFFAGWWFFSFCEQRALEEI